MNLGRRVPSGSKEEWKPELRFARRKTTKREWNFAHNLKAIASVTTSKISSRAECVTNSPPHLLHTEGAPRKDNAEAFVTNDLMALQLPPDETFTSDEHRKDDEFNAGGVDASVQKDCTFTAPAVDMGIKSVELENSKRKTRSSTRKRNKLGNENAPVIQVPKNRASLPSSKTRQKLSSSVDDSCSDILNKNVSSSIMGSTPKPGKEQLSRNKMVSLSQYQMSISEQIEDEDIRKQVPNQKTEMVLKQHSNKFYRTNIDTSEKSFGKSSSGLSKQNSTKKLEGQHDNSVRQSSLRKRLRSSMSDKDRVVEENSQTVHKQESQIMRLKSVSARKKNDETVKSHTSVQRVKIHLSHEKDDQRMKITSKKKTKGIFGAEAISPTFSQNITQSTLISLKYNNEPESVDMKQQDKMSKKKTLKVKQLEEKSKKNSVGACAVYMWDAREMKRGAKDVTDLDVALDCIIRTLEFERDTCQSKSLKKSLSFLQIYMKKEIKNMIQKRHDVHKIQSSIKKKNSQILHLRKELLKRLRQFQDLDKSKKDNSTRNAQKISNSLKELESLAKEMPSKTMMERGTLRSLSRKIVTVGHFPDVA